MPSRIIMPLRRIDERRQALALLCLEIKYDLMKEPLHTEQRSKMGLVKYAPGYVQKIKEPLADQLLRRPPNPCCESGIDFNDAAIWLDRKVAAWRVLVEILKVLSRNLAADVVGDFRHQTKARIAAMVSAGALR